jgi:hypothetical protein
MFTHRGHFYGKKFRKNSANKIHVKGSVGLPIAISGVHEVRNKAGSGGWGTGPRIIKLKGGKVQV